MIQIEQGDVITVDRIKDPILVVSKNFFNQSGEIIGCPVVKESSNSPLHLFVQATNVEGYVQCEKLKHLNLNVRRHRLVGRVSMADIVNITDAIQGIFDYV